MLDNTAVQSDYFPPQIVRLRRTTTDLSRVLHEETNGEGRMEQPNDLADQLVLKPWGSEYLLYSGEESAIWILSLEADAQTSMHCHRFKTKIGRAHV